MEQITFTEVRYLTLEGANACIIANLNGVELSIPLDPNNRHYAEIMRQVEAGELTIQEAK